MSLLNDALEATTDAARNTGARTKAFAGEAVDRAKAVVVTAGEAITDGVITAKVKAHFVDTSLLTDGDVGVQTHDHVVTLTGTVASSAASARAEERAAGTEGVTRVINHLHVKSA